MHRERVSGDELGTEAASAALRRVAEAAAAGRIVAYPTETYYALGADARRTEALETVLDMKGRGPTLPLLLLIGEATEVADWAAEVPDRLWPLADRFWPGPLTVVLRAEPALPEALTGGRGTVALRVSSHPAARALVRTCGFPLTGTSANITGTPPARTAEEVIATFGARLDVIVDGGRAPGGPASTLVDLTVIPYRILRAGPISAADVEDALAAG